MFSNNLNEVLLRTTPTPDYFNGEDVIGEEIYGKRKPQSNNRPIVNHNQDLEEDVYEPLQNKPPIQIQKQVSREQISSDVIVKSIQINLEINLKINVV